jgi:PAS domain S-box-containing protein
MLEKLIPPLQSRPVLRHGIEWGIAGYIIIMPVALAIVHGAQCVLYDWCNGTLLNTFGAGVKEAFASQHGLWHLAHATLVGAAASGFSYATGKENQKERSLLEQHERFSRSITEGAKDAIIVMDSSGKAVFWNPAAETVFGYSRDEMMGRYIHDAIIPPEHAGSHTSALSPFSRTGLGAAIGQTVERTGMRKDGTKIDIALSLSSVRRGEEWLGVAVVRDITALNRQKEEKDDRMEKYASLLGGLEAGFFRTTVEGNYVEVNQAFAEMFGYDSIDDVKRTSVTRLYANPEDRGALVERLKEQGSSHQQNITLLKKNGKPISVNEDVYFTGSTLAGVITEAKKTNGKLLIPICAYCNNARDDNVWVPAERYFVRHKAAIQDPSNDYAFTHGICPPCLSNLEQELSQMEPAHANN